MSALSQIRERPLHAVVEAHDPRVVCLGFVVADDALGIEVADDQLEIHVAVGDCSEYASDNVDELVLLEIHLLHYVVA